MIAHLEELVDVLQPDVVFRRLLLRLAQLHESLEYGLGDVNVVGGVMSENSNQ